MFQGLKATLQQCYEVGGMPSTHSEIIYRRFLVRMRRSIYILGDEHKSLAQAKSAIRNLVWLTYQRLEYQISVKNLTYNNDMGWGCLIRVGQMFLASVLLRYRRPEDIRQIIAAFIDNPNSKSKPNYAFSNFIDLQLTYCPDWTPEKWFRADEVIRILQALNNDRPLNGYSKLKMVAFRSSMFVYETILRKMGYRMCVCKRKIVICSKCNPKDTGMSVFFMTSTMFQYQQSKQILTDLIKFKQFAGILGGKSKSEAVFIIGVQNDEQLVYLDPHVPQKCQQSKDVSQQQSKKYVCNDYPTINISQIPQSMSIGFYVQNLADLMSFEYQFEQLTSKYNKGMLINFIVDQKPQYQLTMVDKTLSEVLELEETVVSIIQQ